MRYESDVETGTSLVRFTDDPIGSAESIGEHGTVLRNEAGQIIGFAVRNVIGRWGLTPVTEELAHDRRPDRFRPGWRRDGVTRSLLLPRYEDFDDAGSPYEPLRPLVRAALAEADELGHAYIGPEHLLLGLFATAQSAAIGDGGIDRLRREVAGRIGTGGQFPLVFDLPELALRAEQALGAASQIAHERGHARVRPDHLLVSLLDRGEIAEFVGSAADAAALRDAALARLDQLGPEPTIRIPEARPMDLNSELETLARERDIREQRGPGDLLRVITVLETRMIGEVTITLRPIEIMERGFTIRARFEYPNEGAPDQPHLTKSLDYGLIVVQDDLGNFYGGGGGGGGGDGVYVTDLFVEQPIPDEAHELVVTVPEIRWIVGFDWNNPIVVPGPARFVVPLEE